MYVIHELDVYLCVGELASLGYDLFDRVVSIEQLFSLSKGDNMSH